MKPVTVAILEDDPEAIQILEQMVRGLELPCSFAFEPFSSSQALEKRLETAPYPDLLFADLELDGNLQAGIDVVKRALPAASATQVIYTTAHVELCTSVYQTDHVCFLLKPLKAQELRFAVEKALAALEQARSKTICLKSGSELLSLPLDEILSIESSKSKLLFNTSSGLVETYGSISVCADSLPSPFIRCHKGFVVNLDKVVKITARDFPHVLLQDGTQVPVSRRRFTEVKEAFAARLAQEL